MKKFIILAFFSFLSYSLFSIVENDGIIDLENLPNYEDQDIPLYIRKDNTPNNNMITNIGATLGRVLFYDKNLSVDNTVACASCHNQQDAFADKEIASEGVAGTTGRHSMRLINSRFSDEENFFWDERASSLEEQTSQPIQDHIEMGFSGSDGDPNLDSLISKLEQLEYYQTLFTEAYGNSTITESRIQNALSQFVRSIISFDSKYDDNRILVANDNLNFPNYTQSENMGRMLFMIPPQFNQNGEHVSGGFGCAGCHTPPEFDIDPRSRNNGVIESFTEEPDFDVTRSPSLRDIFNNNGELNSPLMHTGISMDASLENYNDVSSEINNPNLDNRLRPQGNPQKLNMTEDQKNDIISFLKTLSGNDVYTNPIWSDPFDLNGELIVTRGTNSVNNDELFEIYPNPADTYINITSESYLDQVIIYNAMGKIFFKGKANGRVDISKLNTGKYFIKTKIGTKSFVKY
ncbi:cytochrome c peroxidase [Candidatus Kapabacteria bacterium]|nr:cytochrome c peroxidase [Candidatus Kapabacteria bacterium]